MRTQVGIVGAGPAGLLLSHLLHLQGIDSIVIEARSREYVEGRIRAGVLEHGTVDLFKQAGLGDRLEREGLSHGGINIRVEGRNHRIDFRELTGKTVTVYGQHEVVKDLIRARLTAGGIVLFDVDNVRLQDAGSPTPTVRFQDKDGTTHDLVCDFVAGCDGFHGICRPSIPTDKLTIYEREYPLAWLGVLAESPPISEELIYVYHERGFALFSMRSPHISRLYLQCAPDEDLTAWPDARIWEELQSRLGGESDNLTLPRGQIVQKGVTTMRSFVVEPMQFGRLFLAGDAAHIVPPTGAKGMNLAVTDVAVLSRALERFYASGRSDDLERYSAICLRRAWKAQRFSSWMTSTLHRFTSHSSFEQRVQRAELDYLMSSQAAQKSLAENYVGLPTE